jgi:hypothetical protein
MTIDMSRSSYSILFFVQLLVTVDCIPFPFVPQDDVIKLDRFTIYEVNDTVRWSDLSKLSVYGNGATVIAEGDFNDKNVFEFTGVGWVWESVNIRVGRAKSVFEMTSTSDEAYLQMRASSMDSSSEIDIVIHNRMDRFILQGNQFNNDRNGSIFFNSDINVANMFWKSNKWNGTYDIHYDGDLSKSDIERNRWFVNSVHSNVLTSGTYFKSDDTWCIPPEFHLNKSEVYEACNVRWFLNAFHARGADRFSVIRYSPTENEREGTVMPSEWTFQRDVELDLNDNPWNVTSMTIENDARVKIEGVTRGWESDTIQIISKRNSTVDIRQLHLEGPNREISITFTSDTSHVFFMQSEIKDVTVLGNGLGNVHIQDSRVDNCVISSPVLWASGNVFKGGRVITQPYSGHMMHSSLTDTDYHVSPFYLGEEPRYRILFSRNRWEGQSDLSVSSALTKSVQIHDDVVSSARLAKKISFSNKIEARGVVDTKNRPIMLAGGDGKIWKNGDKPESCPDGSYPGIKDDMGIFVDCLRCPHPERSKNGMCDNMSDLDVISSRLSSQSSSDLSGATNTPGQYALNDMSVYHFRSVQDVHKDCVDCVAMCLDIDPSQVNTTTFTLGQFMYGTRTDNQELCMKCALYCGDFSGTESFCVTIKVLMGVILLAAIGIFVPMFIVAYVILKTRKVRNIVLSSVGEEDCTSCGEPVHKYDHYCAKCGSPHSRSALQSQQ